MNDNPNWKPILDVLPVELHPLVKPKLEEWDKGVTDKINSVRGEIPADYKPLLDAKIPFQRIDEALRIVQMINDDPAAFAKKVDETYELNLFQPPPANESEIEDYDGVDITQHPAFKQVLQQLENLNGTLTSQQQKDKEAQEQAEFEAYLNDLEESYKDKGPFDRMLVTAYISQGMSGDDAVKAYQERLASAFAQQHDPNNQNNQQQEQVSNDTPPPVMGSNGTAGAGLPDTSVKPSEWNTTQTNAAVEEMLRQAAAANQ